MATYYRNDVIPMTTDFEGVDTSQWKSSNELIGILAALNVAEGTYKSLEIPAPDHYAQKREELVAAIKIAQRVDMLKKVIQLEQQSDQLRTAEEKRADTKSQIEMLKRRLGVQPIGIEDGK